MLENEISTFEVNCVMSMIKLKCLLMVYFSIPKLQINRKRFFFENFISFRWKNCVISLSTNTNLISWSAVHHFSLLRVQYFFVFLYYVKTENNSLLHRELDYLVKTKLKTILLSQSTERQTSHHLTCNTRKYFSSFYPWIDSWLGCSHTKPCTHAMLDKTNP